MVIEEELSNEDEQVDEPWKHPAQNGEDTPEFQNDLVAPKKM